MLVELTEALLYALLLVQHKIAILNQSGLAILHLLHLIGQTCDLVHFALSAILRRHLVLAAPPNVAYQGQLRLREIVLAQPLVELVHWKVYNITNGNWYAQRPGALLVARQMLVRFRLPRCN